MSPAASLSPRDRVIPSWTDATVRRASQLVGGPLGRHALVGRARVVTPLRVCMVMALGMLIFGWLAKSPCIQQTPGAGGLVLDSSANRQWISGCYNDVVPAYQIYGLDQSALPYAARTDDAGTLLPNLPYPVLTGALMWLTARLSGGYLGLTGGVLPRPLDVAAFFSVGAVLLGFLFLWTVASTLKIARRRPWDTAILCLSPLLVVHAFTNWDLLPMALLAAAMLAWARTRPALAGVLLGLGVAAKLYPLLFLIPLGILAVRTGKVRPVVTTALAALLSWAVVNVPVALAYPRAWADFFATNVDRKAEFTTLWAVFSSWSGNRLFDPALAAGQSPALLNVAVALLLIAAMLGISWLGLAAARRPRVAQLMFLTVAAFLLITKTWNPQFSLWLLPLAVLATPRWRPVLIWQLVEASLWFLLMLTFATRGDSTARYALLSAYPYQGVAVLRDVLLLLLVALVVRDILRPELDPIRLAGDDDPTGGPFADSPDRFTVVSAAALFGFGRRHRAGAPDPVLVGSPPVADS